jgi:hypothetical protein
MDLLGSLMLATVFCSASGGALSKKSPKGCETSCEITPGAGGEGEGTDDGSDMDQETCIYMYFGRLIAIGMVSGLVAGIPISVTNNLHQRELVHVPYEGSPEWHKQLRNWRLRDRIVGIIGIAYCLFAVNYICLFFANVAEADQSDWMLSAGIGFFQDFIILPWALAFAFTSIALLLLGCTSCRYGLQRAHLTQHGNLDHIREVFNNSSDHGDIKRQLTDNDLALANGQTGNDRFDDESWDQFEMHALHDSGHADIGLCAAVSRRRGSVS